MTVELIAYTQRPGGSGNPVDVVEQAAAVCYDSKPTRSARIALACARSGHLSVWEHINFTFHVSDVSRALLTQLTRHRHASFSVRSQRYCREDGFTYINPFLGQDQPDAQRDFEVIVDFAAQGYEALLRDGAKPEDARMVLPNACCTELYLTCNGRALIEMSHKRLCSRAQREIRELFSAMKMTVCEVCPELARLMRPQCMQYEVPFCPEHNGCGLYPTLREVAHGSDQP